MGYMKDDYQGALEDGEPWAVKMNARLSETPVAEPWRFVLYFLDDVMDAVAETAYEAGADLSADAYQSGDTSDPEIQSALSRYWAIWTRDVEELDGFGDVLLTVDGDHATWVHI